MKHLLSLAKAPIGYVVAFLATLIGYLPSKYFGWLDYIVCPLCEVFCIKDGVQDDPLF